MSNFRGHWNREGIVSPRSVCSGPSEFIPGQAMSVTELANRWRTGQLFTSTHELVFDEDENNESSLFDDDMRVDPLTTVTGLQQMIKDGMSDRTESYDQSQGYAGDGAAAPQEPQAPIDGDNPSPTCS